MHDLALGAEEVASREFPVGFRGFDQHEVRAFLAQVAAELAAARERERLQRDRLEAAEARAASRVLTDDEIESALGHEAGRVLHAAREAAREIRSRAEEQVARLVRDASGEGSRAQQEAESLLARRTQEAEGVAAEIVAEARRQAEAELERAKAEGRQMVAEAQAVRERVLRDLARRRRTAHQQLEQLRAGRERLLEAYRVVRSTLDEATSELSVAEAEARAAAETASLRMGSMPETTVEELEAELSAARDLGLAPVPRPTGDRPGDGAPANGDAAPHRPDVVPEATAKVEGPAVSDTGADDEAEPEPVDVVPSYVAWGPDAEEPASGAPIVDEVSDEAVDDLDDDLAPLDDAGRGSDEVVIGAGRGRDEAVAEDTPAAEPGQGRAGVDELFARLRAEQSIPEEAGTSANGTAASTAVAVDDTPGAAKPSDDDEDVLQRRDAELEPVERALLRVFKRTLADEQNEVLDTLRRSRGPVSIAELLPGASDHTARYLAVVGPELAAAAQLGAGEVEAPAVTDLAVGLAAEVVEDLRARLQRALEAADGQEAPLREGISSAYREWKSARAEPLARHHCVAAHSRGRFAGAQGHLRWVVDAEEGPCPDCDDNALALPPKGELFPTGQRHPPAHVGCRCTIVGDAG